MILRTRIEIALAVAIVASGVAGVRAWVTEHDLRVHAESVEATQKQLQAGYQKQVNDLAKAVADRDASYQRQGGAQIKEELWFMFSWVFVRCWWGQRSVSLSGAAK